MTDGQPPVACSACGRALRRPASVEAKIGPVCQAKKETAQAEAAARLHVASRIASGRLARPGERR